MTPGLTPSRLSHLRFIFAILTLALIQLLFVGAFRLLVAVSLARDIFRNFSMAKLSAFRADTAAIQDGAWIRVNEAFYDDLEIQTRGYTDAFVDAQTLRLIRAAEPFGGDQTRIPNAERRDLNAGLLREFLVLGVRNLLDDDGQPVELAGFLEMLDKPAYQRLARACFEAASRVSTQSARQIVNAVGNSATASAGS